MTEGWLDGSFVPKGHPSPPNGGAPLQGSLYSTVGANTVRPGNCASGLDSPGGYGIRPYGVGEHLAGKTMPASQQSWPARAVQCPAGALIVARPRNSICSRAVLRHRQTARANDVRPYIPHVRGVGGGVPDAPAGARPLRADMESAPTAPYKVHTIRKTNTPNALRVGGVSAI